MSQDIPQWAIDRILAEVNLLGITDARTWTSDEVAEAGDSMRWSAVVRSYARYIAAHEEPPVDPLYEALKAVVELGRYDTREQTDLLRHELALRGLQIVELAKQEPNP